MQKIALLTGGESSEREVALRSAQTVQSELERFFEVDVFDFPSDLSHFLKEYHQFDCAVPVFHGKGGEDGTIQGFLKTLKLPFIFSDVEAHAVAMNKVVTKTLMAAHGHLTPPWVLTMSCEEISFDAPYVIKPIDDGSSIGVEIHTEKSTMDFSSWCFVEKYISGREFTIPVIDDENETIALPVIEIRSKNVFFDFESKYDPALAEEICPAQIDEALTKQLQQVACAAHKVIGVRHLSRTDLIVDEDGKIWFLEINTILGLTTASLVPKSLRAAGIDFGELLKKWINNVTISI